MLKINISY